VWIRQATQLANVCSDFLHPAFGRIKALRLGLASGVCPLTATLSYAVSRRNAEYRVRVGAGIAT